MLIVVVAQARPVCITSDSFNSSECGATNSALSNYGSCSFDACGGDTVAIDMLSCVNDPYLRLYSPGGSLLALNDDYDTSTLCSYLEFVIPDGTECMSYEARLGCVDDTEACSGQLSIGISGETFHSFP